MFIVNFWIWTWTSLCMILLLSRMPLYRSRWRRKKVWELFLVRPWTTCRTRVLALGARSSEDGTLVAPPTRSASAFELVLAASLVPATAVHRLNFRTLLWRDMFTSLVCFPSFCDPDAWDLEADDPQIINLKGACVIMLVLDLQALFGIMTRRTCGKILLEILQNLSIDYM